MCGLSSHYLFGDRTHHAVIDRVFDVVASPRHGEIRLQLDVNAELLGACALACGHTMPPFEHHALKQDPVHSVIVRPNRLDPAWRSSREPCTSDRRTWSCARPRLQTSRP